MRTNRALGFCTAGMALWVACSSTPSGVDQVDDDEAGTATTTTHPPDASTGSTGGTETSGSTGTPSFPEPPQYLPCDVDAVLAEHCRTCHSDPPKYGAPMPLTRHEHVRAPLVSDPLRTVADGMASRIDDQDRPMPPTGALPQAPRAVLRQWLSAGAPGVERVDCDPSEPEPEPEPEPGVGPEHLPCEPSMEFRAHGLDAAEPFHVPITDDIYVCFNFASPFGAATQGTAWAPIVDDERVLHHWILYQTTEPLDYEQVGPCIVPEDASYLAGWAPGRENYVLPDDVGLELPDEDASLLLEVHYNNVAGYDDAFDRSGVALCTVDTPRENAAGFFRLGQVLLDIPAGAEGHEEVGMCPSFATDDLVEPLSVISSFPHMHQLGRAFRTEILRGGDEDQIDFLIDVPQFFFDYQVGYPLDPPIVLQPGDALRTTCTYDNPGPSNVGYGPGTADEMCFNRLLVYPVETLPFRNCMY